MPLRWIALVIVPLPSSARKGSRLWNVGAFASPAELAMQKATRKGGSRGSRGRGSSLACPDDASVASSKKKARRSDPPGASVQLPADACGVCGVHRSGMQVLMGMLSVPAPVSEMECFTGPK